MQRGVAKHGSKARNHGIGWSGRVLFGVGDGGDLHDLLVVCVCQKNACRGKAFCVHPCVQQLTSHVAFAGRNSLLWYPEAKRSANVDRVKCGRHFFSRFVVVALAMYMGWDAIPLHSLVQC